MGFKYKIAEWCLVQEMRFNTGQARVGLLLSIISFFAIIDIWLKNNLGVELSYKLLILIGILGLFSFWVFGYLFDRWGLFIIQAEIGNKRNKLMIDIRKKFNLRDPNGKI